LNPANAVQRVAKFQNFSVRTLRAAAQEKRQSRLQMRL